MNTYFILAFVLFVVDCKPSGYGFAQRPRRDYYIPQQQPQHAMMFSGFYGNPANTYGHRGSMSAFANKDMILTNSFAGEELPIYYPTRAQEATEEEQSNVATVEEEQEAPLVPQKPKNKPQKKNKRKPVPTTTVQPIETDSAEEDEDEDDVETDEEEQNEEVPFRGAALTPPNVPKQSPGNTYFPILFGQGGHANGGGHPGAAVAIANAFSTGKGGVASSHATAYGDPYFSTLNRPQKGNKNGKRGNGNKNNQ